MTFDAYDQAFQADPYPTYARLRDESPVFYDDAWDLTFIARYRDVSEILKDRDRFGRDFRHKLSVDEIDADLHRRIYQPQWPTWTEYIRESFIDLEPPRHTRLRRLVSKAFTRRSSEVFRQQLESAADAILDRVLQSGTMDVIAEYATPIPVAMIAELMGIIEEDHQNLIEWSRAIVTVFDERITEQEGQAAEKATRDFVAYVEEVVAQRRAHPGDDLISAMLEVEDDGEVLSDEEIVGTAILVLNAGHEATVHAIGNSLLALVRNPSAYKDARSVEIGSVVDELLRFDTPLQMFERWVLEDTDVAGSRLEKGSKVGLLFGSANHDESVFSNSEHLDLSRIPNPHVSFGAGLHYCVGAPLARVELEAALGRFVDRVTTIELVSAGDRIDSLVFRGVGRLEVTLKPA